MFDIPYVGSVAAPTLVLGLVLLFLVFWRRNVDIENPLPKPARKKESDGTEKKGCTNCNCGENDCGENDCDNKIKKLSIIYGTTTGNNL
jgi:hypothetical protein